VSKLDDYGTSIRTRPTSGDCKEGSTTERFTRSGFEVYKQKTPPKKSIRLYGLVV